MTKFVSLDTLEQIAFRNLRVRAGVELSLSAAIESGRTSDIASKEVYLSMMCMKFSDLRWECIRLKSYLERMSVYSSEAVIPRMNYVLLSKDDILREYPEVLV